MRHPCLIAVMTYLIWYYRNEYLSHLRQLERILEELKNVFRVIEPTIDNKDSYGNTLRNIIILSCTEMIV